MPNLAIKVDVDTELGTRIGVPNLIKIFSKYNVRGTFLFAMGPDNTGRAIKRIFRKGFLQKAQRTNVVSIYGIKTLCNGIFWPGPVIYKKHAGIMRTVQTEGFEVGIHCYDHVYWQDNLHKISEAKIRTEVHKSMEAFINVFGLPAKVMGAAGWQANKFSLAAYDDMHLMYASDTRGQIPFFPICGHREFNTLQIPTTLPTLDELLGRPEFPLDKISNHLTDLIKPNQLNVLTIHAELEGMKYLEWFDDFLSKCKKLNILIQPMGNLAGEILKNRHKVERLLLTQATIPGRSGTLASSTTNQNN